MSIKPTYEQLEALVEEQKVKIESLMLEAKNNWDMWQKEVGGLRSQLATQTAEIERLTLLNRQSIVDVIKPFKESWEKELATQTEREHLLLMQLDRLREALQYYANFFKSKGGSHRLEDMDKNREFFIANLPQTAIEALEAINQKESK